MTTAMDHWNLSDFIIEPLWYCKYLFKLKVKWLRTVTGPETSFTLAFGPFVCQNLWLKKQMFARPKSQVDQIALI